MLFSYFKKPITNITPYKSIKLRDLYNAITSNVYRTKTLLARQILHERGKEAYKTYKAHAFDYVTFGGVFVQRHSNLLESYSGYICLDIDHQHSLPALKRNLIKDPFLDVQLIFTSPSNDGLKVVLINPYPEERYGDAFTAVKNYFERRYGRKVDSTPDVARACFVCHDPEAYYKYAVIKHEEYLEGLSLQLNPITGRQELMYNDYPAAWDEDATYLEEKTKNTIRMASNNPTTIHLINNLIIN